MTTSILAAGDHFVTPGSIADALAHTAPGLPVTELLLPWPVVPFGAVGNVHEASGDEEQISAALQGHEILVTQMAPITAKVLDENPQLKMIGVCRGGPVNIDVAAAEERGVAVSFAPGRNAAATAELALGLAFSALRDIPQSADALRRGVWEGERYYALENTGRELDESTVGIIGYGAIGRKVAAVLRATGARVLVADPYPAAAEAARRDGYEAVELDELLSRSMLVSLHARLSESTHRMIDDRALGLLPQGSILVNSARAGLVDHDAVASALDSGRLSRFATDVFDQEPPPADWPLGDRPDVIATPHIAGSTSGAVYRAARIVAADVARFVNGEPLAYAATRQPVR